MFALAASCTDTTSGAVSDDKPDVAARSSLMIWGTTRGVQLRDVTASVQNIEGDRASVRLSAHMRPSPSQRWQEIDIAVPVQRDQSSAWQITPAIVIERLVHAAEAATEVAMLSASPTPVPTPATLSPLASPTPDKASTPTPPPPPEGVVVYQSDWSEGMDGWIGSPDWQAVNGRLVNDGTRRSPDPWIEAPARVEPWQAMIIELQVEAPQADYGSFGIVARASDAGWYQFGVRWEDVERGTGTPVITLGASIRQETRRVREEMVAVRWPLTPGPHLFRAEFRDGEARFFVDDKEAGSISEGFFVPGEFIGLWSELTPLEVFFFRVTLV